MGFLNRCLQRQRECWKAGWKTYQETTCVFPIFIEKKPSFWYWYFILLFMKMIEDWQNRPARVEKQSKAVLVCLNLLSLLLYLRHWVLDNSIGILLGCLQPPNCQSFLRRLELTVSEVREENIKVCIRRLNTVAKGERKGWKTWERKMQRKRNLSFQRKKHGDQNTDSYLLGKITVCGYRHFLIKYWCQNWERQL